MVGRLRTKEELAYDKVFKKNDPFKATSFYSIKHEKDYNILLNKATKRGTPVTLNELYILFGSEEKYHNFIKWVREYYQGYGYEPPL